MSSWGDIIDIGTDLSDQKDEIHVMIDKLEELKKKKLDLTNQTLNQAMENRRKEVQALDKEIYDKIQLKKHKKLFA